MKTKKLSLSLFALFITLMFSSCSDDGSNVPESTTSLNENQRNTLALILGDGYGSSLTPAFETINSEQIDEVIDQNDDCDVSGTYLVKGNTTFDYDDQAKTIVGTSTVKHTFTDCVVYVEETQDGEEMTLNGIVNSEVSFDMNVDMSDNLTVEVEVSSTGGIDVSGDNVESGTCGIDMSAMATISDLENDDSVVYTGKICNQTVSHTQSIEE